MEEKQCKPFYMINNFTSNVCFVEGTCKHVAKLTTVVKQNEEDLHDVVLDLQVSGDHGL